VGLTIGRAAKYDTVVGHGVVPLAQWFSTFSLKAAKSRAKSLLGAALKKF